MRIASVVGARPNFVKLAPVHKAIRTISDHVIIHTGQHYDYELSEIFFKEFAIPKPDINLQVGSGSQCFQIAEMVKRLEVVFKEKRFDLVIVYGDTNSTFAGALAANRVGLKTAHVESGLRSFDLRMPEEMNRILTDNICDYLFAPTRTAVSNLRKEHVHGKVYNTGDLSVEVIREAESKLENSNILNKLQLDPKSYVLFTMHRAENTDSTANLQIVIKVFKRLANVRFVFPIHPRTKNVLMETDLYGKLQSCHNVSVIEPVGYLDFVNLIKNSSKVITDSGGVQKESYLLQVPCITIRKSTEWVETVLAGWNLVTDIDEKRIIRACRSWLPRTRIRPVFGKGRTSQIIKDLISKM